MTAIAHLFRVLQVFSLGFLLFTPPAWADQQDRGIDDDPAITAQGADTESDDDGRSFERELADIEAQYSPLIPETAKSSAYEGVPNDVDEVIEEEEDEDE